MDTRSRHGSVWLREDADGETMDLLDRTNMINKVCYGYDILSNSMLLLTFNWSRLQQWILRY